MKQHKIPKIPPDNGMPINTERMLGVLIVGISAALVVLLLLAVLRWWVR